MFKENAKNVCTDNEIYYLAKCYYKGRGIAQNYDKSFKLFERIGNKKATIYLSDCYENSNQNKTPLLHLKYLKMSYLAGNIDLKDKLVQYYKKSYGTTNDILDNFIWLKNQVDKDHFWKPVLDIFVENNQTLIKIALLDDNPNKK